MENEQDDSVLVLADSKKDVLSDRDLLIMVACWADTMRGFLSICGPLGVASSDGPGVYNDFYLPKFPPPVELKIRDLMGSIEPQGRPE